MNDLELALLDKTGERLDMYLEESKTAQIMADIEEIRVKATLSTEAGRLRERIMQALNEAVK